MTGSDDDGRRSGDGRSRTEDKAKVRHGAVAVVFACATPLAVLILPTMPALIATPILGLGALIAGILARRNAKRSGGTAPGTVTAIAIGAIGIGTALVVAPFWAPLTTYETCLTSANTVQDQDTCRKALDEGLETRLPFAAPDLVNRLTGLR